MGSTDEARAQAEYSPSGQDRFDRDPRSRLVCCMCRAPGQHQHPSWRAVSPRPRSSGCEASEGCMWVCGGIQSRQAEARGQRLRTVPLRRKEKRGACGLERTEDRSVACLDVADRGSVADCLRIRSAFRASAEILTIYASRISSSGLGLASHGLAGPSQLDGLR